MQRGYGDVLINAFRYDGFLEFACMIQPEEISGAQRKSHALIVFL
jgi:hypothetical protein